MGYVAWMNSMGAIPVSRTWLMTLPLFFRPSPLGAEGPGERGLESLAKASMLMTRI